jgi:hypothetical protein
MGNLFDEGVHLGYHRRMSGADHRRPTLKLDRLRLQELVKEAAVEAVPEPIADVPTKPAEAMVRRIAEGTAPPIRARRNTIEDPMTTQLLAEVARRTKTSEIAEELADDLRNNLVAAEPTPRRPR